MTDYVLPETAVFSLGRYAMTYLDCLKKHRRGTYTTLLTECRLNQELHRFEVEAKEQILMLTARIAESRSVTESLKATDPMEWAAQMNAAKQEAEEIALKDFPI